MHRKDLSPLPFWICDSCGNFVGCHHKTQDRTRPLGCIPNAEMKNAREHIHVLLVHVLLDSIWKSRQMGRREVYDRVSKKIGKTSHTAELRSIDDARNVYRILLDIKRGC